jgi:hypothetical protein
MTTCRVVWLLAYEALDVWSRDERGMSVRLSGCEDKIHLADGVAGVLGGVGRHTDEAFVVKVGREDGVDVALAGLGGEEPGDWG